MFQVVSFKNGTGMYIFKECVTNKKDVWIFKTTCIIKNCVY